MPTRLSHLVCGNCGRRHYANRLQSRCGDCAGPLLARYRIEAMPDLGGWLSPEDEVVLFNTGTAANYW